LQLRAANGGVWQDRGAVGAFDWQFDGCPHCGGGIASEPDGRLHSVVWSGKAGVEGLYYLYSNDAGGHWSPPVRIADGNSRESDIAVLADGRIGIVFVGVDGVSLLQSRDAGAHWKPPQRLSADGAVADHPRIVATQQGFRVFWTQKRTGGGKVWAVFAP
jgi:photosystem II stability/assembly factor-like uncharacterized protein